MDSNTKKYSNLELPLYSAEATKLHIDINSCFATIEQQANPFLRGRPIAVVAHDYDRGCILAASVEAKKLGIKTGMILSDARSICSNLISRTPDPDKYRHVHKKLREILSAYTSDFYPKSIDEFILDLSKGPYLKKYSSIEIARKIKQEIKENIGEWITVSIGIGTNRFWAKTAANFKKPNGLTLMNKSTVLDIYSKMDLLDIHGINIRNKIRLNKVGIYNPIDFLNADRQILYTAFQSVAADYWYKRLRGWEIDDIEFSRKSFGNTYSMPGGPVSIAELSPILMKLVFKASYRMRKSGYKCRGVHLGVRYKEKEYWHKRTTLINPVYKTEDVYQIASKLLNESPRLPVSNLAVTCFELLKESNAQSDLFLDINRQDSFIKAVDDINNKWDRYTIFPARMLSQIDRSGEAIGFGNVKEIV